MGGVFMFFFEKSLKRVQFREKQIKSHSRGLVFDLAGFPLFHFSTLDFKVFEG